MKEQSEFEGATKELLKLVKEEFGPDNDVRFLTTEEGFQRIEVYDRVTGDAWQTLEAVQPIEDDNYDEISTVVIGILVDILDDSLREYALLN